MGEFLWAGTALGALAGVIHAAHIYRQRVTDEAASHARASYFAVWAVGLWTVFGAYLLFFWILGAIGLTISRMRRTAEAKP